MMIGVHYMVLGRVRRTTADTLVATWMNASVETGAIVARDSVRLVGASQESLVAALARTVVLELPRQP